MGSSGLWLLVHRIPLIMSQSAGVVTGALSHAKPASTGNWESVFPLQFSLPYFVGEFWRADLQLLSDTCTFWKYFLAHDWDLLFKLAVPLEECLAVNVDFSHKLCRCVPITDNRTDPNLVVSTVRRVSFPRQPLKSLLGCSIVLRDATVHFSYSVKPELS
jgi:hypothetical protein